MYDLVIVGGGPAAFAAAAVAQTKQLKVATLYDTLGGKVGWHPVHADIDQYSAAQLRWTKHDRPDLPGDDFVRFLVQRVSEQPRHLLQDRVTAIERGLGFFRVDTCAHGVLETTTVIVATGATPASLPVLGAQRFVTHGLGYSSTTYAQLVAGHAVAVIGTTVRALRGAAELARSAQRVYVVAPHSGNFHTPLGDALRSLPNVEILDGYTVQELIGIDRLEEVIVTTERFERRLGVRYAFADLGLVPNSQFVAPLKVTDAHGFVMVDQHNATAVPGLFAAGDVTIVPCEHVLVAMGDGARAALSAYQYLVVHGLAEQQARAASA